MPPTPRPFALIDDRGRYLTSGGQPSHFTTPELTCRCDCGAFQADQRLIDLLERIRAALGGNPVHVVSGVRCWARNLEVGGVKRSQHLPRTSEGEIDRESGTSAAGTRAADLVLKGMPAFRVQAYLKDHAAELQVIGIGQYDGFTHVDVREGPPTIWRG